MSGSTQPRGAARLLLFALVVLPAGCGPGALPKDDVDRARSAVQTGLDAWKKGEPLAKLPAHAPNLEFADPDWAAGTKLTAYEITKAEGQAGDHARCWTTLSLQDRRGKKSDKHVVYEVKLGDKAVVGRDPFH